MSGSNADGAPTSASVWTVTGDDGLVADLWPAFERALSWLREHGVRGDGFLAYETEATEGGLGHRAWKNSDEGIVHPDGTVPDGPLAVVEVQGYYYDALRRAADLYREVGDAPDRADALDATATDLRAAFDGAFWLPDEAFYAVAHDGDGEPVPAVTSNPGHCLWSGVVPAERNPQSYHRGSVWPHDTSLAALGMLAADRSGAARTVASGLFDAAARCEAFQLPELFAGFDREAADPVPYGVECRPQAWAAGATLACRRVL